MHKYILGVVLVFNGMLNITFADNYCMDLDRQEMIAPPQIFPQLDINMRCGWDHDDFSVQYTTSSKAGFIEDYDYRFANLIALENSKAWDDYLYNGDGDDPSYVDNMPFITPEKEGSETFVIALEVKYLHQGEVLLSVLSPLTSYIQLSCIDRSRQYEVKDRVAESSMHKTTYVAEILRADQCQKAIETFNIPLSLEDIQGLKPAQGSLN